MRHQPFFWIYRFLLLVAFSTLGLVLLSTVRYGGVPQEITRVSVVTEIHSGESYADRSGGMENVLHGLQNGSLRDQRQRVGDTGREREYSLAQHFRLHTLEAALTLGVCGNPQKFRSIVPRDTWRKAHKVCHAVQYFKQWFSIINTQQYSYQFVIPAREICNKDTDTVVLIHSHHGHSDRRTAIRDTWGGAVQRNTWPNATVTNKVKVAFLFGVQAQGTLDLTLGREADIHGDIIQGSFMESYGNLTLKSLMGLKWVLTYCPQVKYVIKSDDDMFINFPVLLYELRRRDMRNSILGHYRPTTMVQRDDKWREITANFPFVYYPPYVSGASYVISGDLVPELYDASKYVPYLGVEDVYTTGILAKLIGAKHVRIHGDRFLFGRKPHVCDVIGGRPPILTGTGVNASHQIRLWRSIQTGTTSSCSEAPVERRLEQGGRAGKNIISSKDSWASVMDKIGPL